MIDKKKIKIVKRDQAVARKNKSPQVQKPRESARKMVANVSEWVADLKQRKTTETKVAFDMLFNSAPRTNES